MTVIPNTKLLRRYKNTNLDFGTAHKAPVLQAHEANGCVAQILNSGSSHIGKVPRLGAELNRCFHAGMKNYPVQFRPCLNLLTEL